jgi:hypothetical protein
MSHAACPYQISAKSDELMRSSGGNDVGSEGGKINFLSRTTTLPYSPPILNRFAFSGARSAPLTTELHLSMSLVPHVPFLTGKIAKLSTLQV